MLIAAMEPNGHLAPDPGVRQGLESISAATIDLILGPVREQARGRGRRRTAPSSAIQPAVPIHTCAVGMIRRPGSSRPISSAIAVR